MKSFLIRSLSLSVLTALSLSLATAASAHAEGGNPIGRFSVLGDLNYNVYSSNVTVNSVNYQGTGSLGYGGGVLASFGLANTVGLETGAILFVRKINVDLGAGNSSSAVIPFGSMTVLHIPVDLVFGMGDLVSVIAGVFDEIPLDSNSGNNNLGFEAGLRFNFALGTSSGKALFVDARYNHGLTDQGGFHTNELHAMVGLSFGGT